jgi:hypothetical protein
MEIQQLTLEEVDQVSGGGFFAALGYVLGYATALGAATQQAIDRMDNPMLGAMQYGA